MKQSDAHRLNMIGEGIDRGREEAQADPPKRNNLNRHQRRALMKRARLEAVRRMKADATG
jgi:hypothetical protein